MTSRDFCYWLQGLFELSETKTLSEQQVQIIKNHLAMVFYHEIDPSFPKEQQEDLSRIHSAPPPKKPREIAPGIPAYVTTQELKSWSSGIKLDGHRSPLMNC